MSQSQRRSLALLRQSTTTTPLAAATAATITAAQLETSVWRNSRRQFRYLEFGECFFLTARTRRRRKKRHANGSEPVRGDARAAEASRRGDCVWSRDRAKPTVGREKWRKDQSASGIMDGSSSLPRRCHLCLFTSVRARAPRAE